MSKNIKRQQIPQLYCLILQVIGVWYWEIKEIREFLFNYISMSNAISKENIAIIKSQFKNLEDEIFKWRIFDSIQKCQVRDIAMKIQEEISMDPISQQILGNLFFIKDCDKFEKMLTVAFTTNNFEQYEKDIRQALLPLSWAYIDLMYIKLCIYKIFSKNFKFPKLSIITFFDFIERLRYIAIDQHDFYNQLKKRDNNYHNFFAKINSQCLSYLLSMQQSQGSKQKLTHLNPYQKKTLFQQTKASIYQDNIKIENYLAKFISILFFESLEISLYDVVKSGKFTCVLSPATFPTIKKIILTQLDFYFCPQNFLFEVKKKLRFIKIQLGLKPSFNEQLFHAFQQSQQDNLTNLSKTKSLTFFYSQVIQDCTMSKALNKQYTIGQIENIQIIAVTLINFIFDIVIDNFPVFVSFYDCLSYSKFFNIPSFYFEKFSLILKETFSQLIVPNNNNNSNSNNNNNNNNNNDDNIKFLKKQYKRIDRRIQILIDSISQYE